MYATSLVRFHISILNSPPTRIQLEVHLIMASLSDCNEYYIEAVEEIWLSIYFQLIKTTSPARHEEEEEVKGQVCWLYVVPRIHINRFIVIQLHC